MEISTQSKRAYIDTNVLIYLLEGTKQYQEKVASLISQLDKLECKIFTSEITLAECLVKPFADEDTHSQSVYISSIKSSDFLTVKSVSKKILIEAARLRSVFKNKLPDSIHLATALENHCDLFIGNDKKLKTGSHIKRIIIDEYEV